MRNHNVRGTAKLVLALPALLGALAFATIAAAQSGPEIMESTGADTGFGGLPYLTMTVPYDASAGQLLVAFVAVQAKSPAAANPWATVAIPAGGWTEIAPLPRVCGNNLAVSIAWRIAQAGDAGSDFTWGFLTGVTGYLLPVY